MKLSEIYKIADQIAPKRLSDEYCAKYGAYDNSGVLVDVGEEVTGALFSLDLTSTAVAAAKAKGYNLIVTHHPAIYAKLSNLRIGEGLGRNPAACLKNGISVLSMHLNLDGAEGGIDQSLQNGVRAAAERANGNPSPDGATSVMHPLTGGGYGRAYSVAECDLQNLERELKKEFCTERLWIYGNGVKRVCRAASFCGAGADEEAIAFAKAQGVDLLISADFKHHLLTLAKEEGLALAVMTHYASENYGFQKYYEKMRRQLSVPCDYHTDEDLL